MLDVFVKTWLTVDVQTRTPHKKGTPEMKPTYKVEITDEQLILFDNNFNECGCHPLQTLAAASRQLTEWHKTKSFDIATAHRTVKEFFRNHIDQDDQAKIDQIAKTKLQLPTLESQGSDRLDFHEFSVSQINAALQEAFAAGRESTKR
jgi:hypothetical protein